jgi:hypothetical protein
MHLLQSLIKYSQGSRASVAIARAYRASTLLWHSATAAMNFRTVFIMDTFAACCLRVSEYVL